MTTFVRALHSELLKTKRTLAFWLTLVMPAGIAALQFFATHQRADYYLAQGIQEPWLVLGEQTFQFWALLALPLFVTLETALVAGLEHANDHWKQLFARPVPRGSIYFAKLSASMVLIALSLISLLVFTMLAGAGLSITDPALHFGGAIPWLKLFKYIGIIFLGSWLLISIHTWVALRWRSFVVASAVGIVLTVAGMIVVNADWGPYYPWALAALAFNDARVGLDATNRLLFSGVGGALVALIGGWEFCRRDVL